EKEILTTVIERMEKDLESIIVTIGRLMGYWETRSAIISDLLDKVNVASDNELELDELHAKDYCVTIRGLLAEDQAKFN
ncbi:14154_t:CDS:2, partial [Racocetra persica]